MTRQRISVLLPEDVPAIHTQERRVLRQWPPAKLWMLLQFADRDAANLALSPVGGPRVIDQPVCVRPEGAVAEVDHRVKRHPMTFLPEEQKIARTRRAHIAANKIGVVAAQNISVGELCERTIGDVIWRERSRPRSEQSR